MCLAMIGLAGCGPAITAGPSGSAGATGSGSPVTPAASIDGPARLSQALQALSAGYVFKSTVTVGGKVAVTTTGRQLGDSSEAVIEVSGSSITYRTIPPTSWVQEPDGDWVEVDAKVAPRDPVAPFRDPLAVKVVEDGPTGLQLDATYPTATISGSTAEGNTTVRILLEPDGAVVVAYTSKTTAGDGASTTKFRGAATQDPIVSPPPAPSGG